MATAQCETSTSNAITLKGSTELVTEFFGYAVNNILFQRGVYPPEEFERKRNSERPAEVTKGARRSNPTIAARSCAAEASNAWRTSTQSWTRSRSG